MIKLWIICFWVGGGGVASQSRAIFWELFLYILCFFLKVKVQNWNIF